MTRANFHMRFFHIHPEKLARTETLLINYTVLIRCAKI